MSRRLLSVVVPTVLACAIGYVASRPAPAAARRSTAEVAAMAPAPHRASMVNGAKAVAAQATRARYRLTSEHRALIEGKTAASVEVAGVWTVTEREGGRAEIELQPARLVMEGDAAPSKSEVAGPFVVVKRDGVLAAMAFAEGTSGRARDLLASLATTFQWTEGSGDTWTVEEEDLTGRYEATYTRAGDTITRSRGRYTEVRGPAGLAAKAGEGLRSTEESAFTFDARGLVSASVKLDQITAAGRGMPTVTMSLRATLVREEVAEVDLAAGPDFKPEPITTHVDRAAIAKRRAEAIVAGAHASELVEAARAAARLGADQADRDRQIAKARRRLSSLVQIEPTAADEVARAIRRDASDAETVRVLAGALASAPAPGATEALASVLDGPLPEEARSTVLMNLALAAAPSAESAAALTKAIDGPLGGQAALALGAEAKKLGEDGDGAVSELLRRYEGAKTRDEQRTYLQALANTGSRDALPVMLAAIGGADFDLARVGAFGLRLIPGDDVDDTLWSLIASGSTVIVEAVKAVGYRAPELWEPRLRQAKETFKEEKRVVESIQAVLNQWANRNVQAKP
ncbi:MAG: hypothetical protein QM820_27320 [Minicystis sp.]